MPPPAHRDRESKYTAISMKDAEEIMKKIGKQTNRHTESMSLGKELLGRVTSRDITAGENMPRTRVSTKDGYAVVAKDGAKTKTVIGVSLAGSIYDGVLQPGQCVRISTGGVVPEGATAVVMVEHTVCTKSTEEGEELEIEIKDHVSDGTNIREPGSEVRQSDVILKAGTKIGSAEYGILSAFGIDEICVYKKPLVTVISTGNELVDANTQHLPIGMIRDSNGPQMIALFKEYGIDAIDGGRVSDDFTCIEEKLKYYIMKSDLIVTSGGVSMGEKDNLKEVLQKLGMEIQFGRVMMKPGLPCTVATGWFQGDRDSEKQLKTVLALPGNPASAWVCSHLFAIPLIRTISGFNNPNHTLIKVRLATDIKLGDRPEYVRAYLENSDDGDFAIAHVTGNQISSNIGSLVGAQVLLMLPIKQDKEYMHSGELVKAMLL